MNNPEILDSLFGEAVSAIDAGDVNTLECLLTMHPYRLDSRSAWLHTMVGDVYLREKGGQP